VETENEIERALESFSCEVYRTFAQEHGEVLAEFNSLLAGVEATLGATGMSIRRMSHQDLFLEIKRALHPLGTTLCRTGRRTNRSGTRVREASRECECRGRTR